MLRSIFPKTNISHRLFFMTAKFAEWVSSNEKKQLINNQRNQNKKRKLYDYKLNHTIAIQLPHSDGKPHQKVDALHSLLELSKEHIIEHASRRVDLYFYTLIAYYKSYRFPIQYDTKVQHGIGHRRMIRYNHTEACHSSLFPFLIDIDPEKTEEVRQIRKIEEEDIIKKSLLFGTHFYDNLNSTVELPAIANHFDSLLEGKIRTPSQLRKNALEILRRVSYEKITPIEGMTAFFISMTKAFNDINLMSKSSKFYFVDGNNLKNKILELEKEGTFQYQWNFSTKTILTEYLDMMLRLSPVEKEICKKQPKEKDNIYRKKMGDIQNEILSSKSSVSLANKL